MQPNVTIKEYYLNFITNAKVDIYNYNIELQRAIDNKNQLHSTINDNIDKFKELYNIDLNSFTKEWVEKVYNEKETMYNKFIKLINTITEDTDRSDIFQILKYCHALKDEYKYNKLIALANKRKDIKFSEYRRRILEYYTKVHKCVLEGNGYKYGYDLGTYIINYWRVSGTKGKGKKIDFAATNAKKKELLAKGYKLYDEREAIWYKERNIPYNGVDYRVYKDDSHYYEITFINSKFLNPKVLDYQRTEYVINKYRGMSYKEMADQLCQTLDDIYNLQVDIKYKLNILLYKHPTKYLNFIRNASQFKHEY